MNEKTLTVSLSIVLWVVSLVIIYLLCSYFSFNLS